MKTWTLEVQKLEDGDQFIEFPQELLADVGWKEGDVLEWTPNDDGSWILKKKLDENHENTDEKI